MVFIRPAAECCCGCPAVYGVWFAMVFQLVTFMSTIGFVIADVLFQMDLVDTPLWELIVSCGFSMFGVVIIGCGMWGVWYRSEIHVRLYLYFVTLCIVGEFVYMGVDLDENWACTESTSFLCFWTRLKIMVEIVVMFLVEVYFYYLILSFCHDLAQVGGGPVLKDLMNDIPTVKSRRQAVLKTTVDPEDEDIKMSTLVGQDFRNPMTKLYHTFGESDIVVPEGLGHAERIFGRRAMMEPDMQYSKYHKAHLMSV